MANAFADIAGRALRTADGKSESRRKLIGAVRAACQRLGIDDDDRRELQLGLTGKASLTKMSLAEIGQVLDQLNRDWKGPAGHRAHVGKIRALWWTLYWIGAADQPGDAALDGFVRRQTGVSALRFLDHRAAHSVVDALKAWAAREGVVWTATPGATGDRRAVVDAIWIKLRDAGRVAEILPWRYCAAALAIGADPDAWSRHEWDAAIRMLGKQLRHVRGRG